MKKYFRHLLALLLLGILLTPLYMYFSRNVSALITQYPHRIPKSDPAVYEVKPGQPKGWVPLKAISGHARWAIVFSEDWAFYQHEGIDVEQIKVALEEMMTEKRFRGASTITQQMVKNVFLTEERTPWRKLHEMILAQKVEKVLTKPRILEVYLNVIEFGPNIYGIREAARYYFKKQPSGLTPREGAFLAMLLPSPKRYSISYRKRRLTSFARARIHTILTKMRMGKVLTPEQCQAEKRAKLSWER